VTIPRPYTDQDAAAAIAAMTGQGDIADDQLVASEPATFTGEQPQRDTDIIAVQLRPESFSPKMIEKAGRLAVAGAWDRTPEADTLTTEAFTVLGDSGDWYTVRVFGRLTWFATCTCPARASRYNRAGACAHRALGGWLRAQVTGEPIPRWPDLTMPVLVIPTLDGIVTEEPSDVR
jgi:hypothetical protein